MSRKKLTKLEKLMSKASRSYKKLEEIISSEYQQKLEMSRVQIATGKGRIGRPPKSLSELRRAALHQFEEDLDAYRKQEKAEGKKPVSEDEIVAYRADDNAGRPGKDRVLHLKKYIRTTKKSLEKIKATDASEFERVSDKGRAPKPKSKRIDGMKSMIAAAEAEVKFLISEAGKADQIYYEIFDVQLEMREVRRQIKEGGDLVKLERKLARLDKKRMTLEAERAEAQALEA